MIVRRSMRGFGDEWDNITEATSLVPGSSAFIGSTAGGVVTLTPTAVGVNAGPTPGFPGGSGSSAWSTISQILSGGPKPQTYYYPPTAQPSNAGLFLGLGALGLAGVYLATRKRTA